MFTEDELLPISALQHFVYCRRQAALIHLERAWRDNADTVDGLHFHQAVDSGQHETRGALKILRSVPLTSMALGLSGRADVVELHRTDDDDASAAPLDAARWRVRPIEYKRGRAKKHRADEVQLCAQALCLEEMLGIAISEGDLFYGKMRRRKLVRFDETLREATRAATAGMHALFATGKTPAADPGPKCRDCSLRELCRPHASERSARRYLQSLLREPGELA
jgi:CRISPR-associated exonuclease Cas4